MTRLRLFSTLAAMLGACAAVSAQANGLQVTPVSVTIPDRSGVITLANGSSRPMRTQVRVFRWTQRDGEDSLGPTDAVMASPPFARIAPEGQQVVRLVRAAAAMAGQPCEESYRVVVDELPEPDAGEATGLRYLLRYSVPVYLTAPGCEAAAPQLGWKLARSGDAASLEVTNTGKAHAQLAGVTYIDGTGKRTALAPGLLGYVLPGSHRTFALTQKASLFASGGELEVMVNGAAIHQQVKLAAASQ